MAMPLHPIPCADDQPGLTLTGASAVNGGASGVNGGGAAGVNGGSSAGDSGVNGPAVGGVNGAGGSGVNGGEGLPAADSRPTRAALVGGWTKIGTALPEALRLLSLKVLYTYIHTFLYRSISISVSIYIWI